MTLAELIQRLDHLLVTGHGGLVVEVRNPAGDFGEIDERDGIRISGSVVVIDA
jgi:hypothetical protein